MRKVSFIILSTTVVGGIAVVFCSFLQCCKSRSQPYKIVENYMSDVQEFAVTLR